MKKNILSHRTLQDGCASVLTTLCVQRTVAMHISFLSKRLMFPIMLLFSTSLFAQLKLAAVFSDNMVLQRDKPAYIWGKANPGAEVTVQFATQTKTTNADSAGKWQVELKPLKASGIPQELVVKAETTITLFNVLVGDVWLCSGQSNMEYPLDRKLKKYAAPKKGKDPSEKEIIDNTKPSAVRYPIRYLYVERTLNKTDLPTKGWVIAKDSIVKYVSAIGYFFGKEISKEAKVPIGIISSSWGGTRIEEWTPDWAYASSPVFKDSAMAPGFKIDGTRPGQKFKGLIEPMTPYAIKGILWYQGESNCMIEDQQTYPEKFRVFSESWRTLFKDEKLPVFTVQIAPYLYSSRKDPKKHSAELLPLFWEAQTKCMKFPNTEMVVTTDLVDKLSDIHPSYKWIVAHRLALQAISKTTKKKRYVYSGPIYSDFKIKSNGIELEFTSTGGGLASSDKKPLNWFTIAGEDGKFVPATVVISKDKLIVSAPQVANPKYVRFAWDEKAQPNFVNKEGLPAIPFRTDDLKIN